MKIRIFFLIWIVAGMLGVYNYILHPPVPVIASAPLTAERPPAHRVMLLPLDSRPPCRKFVIDAGRIANTEVIVPPPEILDYYTEAGKPQELAEWIEANIDSCDAAILSIDQLLYGGLLAAREAGRSPAEIETRLDFLTSLHERHPQVPLYAFNILPRLTPPASIDGYEERRDITKYSRLLDEYSAYDGKISSRELTALEQKIPPESLARYRSLFEKNTVLNEKLSLMAKQGILKRLIIGQDDGEKYGIPNIEKRLIRQYLQTQNIPEEQVCITHGADEVALTLLAEINDQRTSFQPKIYVEYNSAATPDFIMPYMAVSTGTTVEEKLQMLHAHRADTPEAADIILFVSCGNTDTLSDRQQNAARLHELVASGKPVALVDLSKHFQASETLLPFLIKNDTPINALTAYAGWNTTSNSIGTALAEALLFTSERAAAQTKDDVLFLYQNNLRFLNNRFLEDYFYLKDVIDLVNTQLKKAGYTNVYDLDLDHNYRWCNFMLRQAMQRRITTFKNTRAFSQPFNIETPDGPTKLHLREMTADISYPWPRTFEIYLQTTLWIDEAK